MPRLLDDSEMHDAMKEEVAAHHAGLSDHEAWEDLMIAVLDGRAGERRRELEGHVSECAGCRAVFAQYRRLFTSLRLAPDAERPRQFWDDLALEIDRRLTREAEVPGAGGVEAKVSDASILDAGVSRPEVSGSVMDLRSHRRLTGWRAVSGGLIAAGIAVVLLIGVYLKSPRPGVEPQAFTTATRDQGFGGDRLDDELALGLDPALLLVLAATSEREGSAAQDLEMSVDPLSALADADEALQDLTPEEAEELLESLEAQT
jgi:hypothetical protein